jgi:hypothetical protein
LRAIHACPESVVGRFAAVTCFDSSPPSLTETEVARGWSSTSHGTAISPELRSSADLPGDDSWDEYWIFDEPAPATPLPSFVNCSAFSLAQAESEWAETASLRTSFWEAIEKVKPLAYLSVGDRVVAASTDRELIESMAAALASQE